MSKCRLTVKPARLYTKSVRADLMLGAPAPARLQLTDSAEEWASDYGALRNQVIGLLLCRYQYCPDLMTYLSEEQLAQTDFWILQDITDRVVYFEVIDAACFSEPQTVVQFLGQARPKGCFFRMTEASRLRLQSSMLSVGGADRSVPDVLHEWACRHHGQQPFPGQDRMDVATSMFAPYAVLCAKKVWRSFAFPFPLNKASRRGLGLHLINHLLRHIRDPVRGGVVNEVRLQAADQLSPDLLQSLADMLRCNSTASQDALQFHVSWLRDLRADMLRQSHMRGAWAYSMHHMILCMLAAGCLKDAHRFREVCELAIAVVVREPALRHHLMQAIRDRSIVPSPTTLYRHRLTLSVGFASFCAQQSQEMVEMPGGVCRWCTVDASPQGSYDWCLNGACTLAVTSLPERFRDALELIQRCRADREANVSVIVERLQTDLVLQSGVPTGVASGCAGVLHKLHATAHSVRMTSSSWLVAGHLLNSTFSWTGDLGTESHFCRHRGSMRQLFGDWIVAEDNVGREPQGAEELVDVADAAGQEEGDEELPPFNFMPVANVAGGDEHHRPAAAAQNLKRLDYPDLDAYALDMTQSLYITGVLHVVASVTKGLADSMTWWKQFVIYLTQVCRMLSRKWSLARLLATCFNVYPNTLLADELSGFNASVNQGRWGSVLHAVGQLLPLKLHLRRCWSLQRFQMGAAAREHEGDAEEGGAPEASRSLLPEIVDQAIRSDLFWSYAEAVSILGDTLEELSVRAEGCACHSGREIREIGAGRGRRSHGARVSACVMATRMGPEMAAGEVMRLLRRLCAVATSSLLVAHSFVALGEEDRALVLTDFSAGRRHILFMIQLKLGHWRQLPFILFGLGHPDEDVARSCFRSALQQWAAAGDAAEHHYISTVFCAEGSPANQLARAWCFDGHPRASFPLLERWAGRFRFTPITERWIEGRHALANAHLRSTRHASAVHVAYTNILPQVQSHLAAKPEALAELAERCIAARSPRLAVSLMGCSLHPAYVSACRKFAHKMLELNRSGKQRLVEILYHVDSATLFEQRQRPPHGPPPPPADGPAGGGPAGGGGAGPPADGPAGGGSAGPPLDGPGGDGSGSGPLRGGGADPPAGGPPSGGGEGGAPRPGAGTEGALPYDTMLMAQNTSVFQAPCISYLVCR